METISFFDHAMTIGRHTTRGRNQKPNKKETYEETSFDAG